LGKTSLAYLLAKELGVGIKPTSGPVIEKAGDLSAILTSLQDKELLFIDEIHRLHPSLEELLYSAMEDFSLDVIIGQGPGARSHKLKIKRFTLVGATTRAGKITAPLRSRFGIVHRLDYYQPEDLKKIILRSARILKVKVEEGGAEEIARRARGTPRIANRLLRRVRDFAEVKGDGRIDEKTAQRSAGSDGGSILLAWTMSIEKFSRLLWKISAVARLELIPSPLPSMRKKKQLKLFMNHI